MPSAPHRSLAALASALLLASSASAATDLLYSKRGGSPLWDYCYGKSDTTLLPADPRSLVQPGIGAGRAIAFNAFWKDCHVDPVAVQEAGHAKTCGELRARFYRGDKLLDTGAHGVGALFTGDDPTTLESNFGSSTLTAAQYNSLWLTWGGFLLRPDNFDDLVAERYGSAFGSGRNPYPLPFEDPNRTNGGSGRLPEMFTQLRLPDGPVAFGKHLHSYQDTFSHAGFSVWTAGHVPYSIGVAAANALPRVHIDDPDDYTPQNSLTDRNMTYSTRNWLERYKEHCKCEPQT